MRKLAFAFAILVLAFVGSRSAHAEDGCWYFKVGLNVKVFHGEVGSEVCKKVLNKCDSAMTSEIVKGVQSHDSDHYTDRLATMQGVCGEVSRGECQILRETEDYQRYSPLCPDCEGHAKFAGDVAKLYNCPVITSAYKH